MKIRTIISISTLGGAFITGGVISAQESGAYGVPSNKKGLYSSVNTPIKIGGSPFRKGAIEDDDKTPSYSAYPMEKMTPVIPPPPIQSVDPVVEPEPEVIPDPVVIPKPKPRPAPVVVKAPPVVKPTPKPVVKSKPKVKIPPPPIQSTPSRAAIVKAPPVQKQPTPSPSNRFPASRPSVLVAKPVPAPVAVSRVREPAVIVARPVAQPQPQRPVAHSQGSPLHEQNRPTLMNLRNQANEISRQKIAYRFGRSHPAFGGLDSPGSVQYLLNEVGLPGVPRSTNAQNSWVRVNNLLTEFHRRPSVDELSKSLVPGHLIFWGDSYTGRLTHVMLYLGFDANRGHLAFGTRGGTEVGLNGNEVDIFSLRLGHERIIATGKVPGLMYH